MEKDQEFVEYVVKALVNKPEAVKAERTVDEMGVLITLHVDKEDMGYIIGRSGQTARSLRTLLRIVGAKNNARVNLKIYEPEELRRARQEQREAAGGSSAPHSAPRQTAAPKDEMEDIDTSAVDDLRI
ncbi:RNA-binding protein [Candidatus Uhrbacteria bacterium CG10_big_fil_rev_8_21_14_0_10_48_11]|uniref:RNA-binding protein KhpA n=1 Tax=Candidatus Uhrbacteria bacterium CG10_big_fil_rev_8_21_14_0_10_48_11 TaxID=1975037 RepID=A0A2M8LFV5_9BACT|nr:MAG: RNA-binding protein [Candidatus Uhrbacteria bacterium CG10_big_fil_rev_8_21_14_0_10_48_11]